MNRGIVWLPSAFRLAAILSGGKTPARWGRDLARRTAGLTAVRRGSAWVEEFGVTHPRLCEGPLLGHTLTALTGLADSMQEAQPQTAQPGRERFAQRESLLESMRDKVTASDRIVSRFRDPVSIEPAEAKRKVLKALTSGPGQDLFQLRPQADRLLLSRLAGNKLPFKGTEQEQARSFPVKEKRAAAFKGTEPAQTRSFSAEGKRNEALFSSAYRNSVAQQDWLSRLAQRAGKALNQEQLEPAETAKSAWDDAQASGPAPSLTEQWTMPLDGMCASLDMLNQLAQGNLPSGEERRETAQRRFTRGQSSSLEKPKSLSSRAFWRPDEQSVAPDQPAGWRNDLTDGANNFDPKTKLADTAQAESTFFAPEPRVNEPVGHGESESKSPVPTAPPNLALPSLLPPQRVGVRPLPVAAATARQGAVEEEMLATDDLEALSAKIKLILDEQARRHGIDV